MELESLDDIHELVDLGWIEITENRVDMHPLIQETLHQIKWKDGYRKIAINEMQMLMEEIKLPNYRKMREALNTSRSVLLHGGRDDILRNEKTYKDLLFITLISSSKDQEEYIINNCEKLLSDKEYKNPYAIIELYDYIVYLFCQKSDYDGANQYIERAKIFAQGCKDNYIWGIYYDMLTDFYEELLNGAYYSENEKEIVLKDKMFATMDKAIYHMRKSKYEKSKKLYAKYILGKATLMIRSTPGKYRKIKALIREIKKSIVGNTAEYAEVSFIYYMVRAWYYTLCEPEKDIVLKNLKEAAVINEKRNVSELDMVDYYYIPAANMMWEFSDIPYALGLLDEACKICDAHVDEIPYIRKKLELIEYQQQVQDSEYME